MKGWVTGLFMAAGLHELSDWPSCVAGLSERGWPFRAPECGWPLEHDWPERAEGQPVYMNGIMYQ